MACFLADVWRPDEAAALVVMGQRNLARAMSKKPMETRLALLEKAFPFAELLSSAVILSVPAAKLAQLNAGSLHVHGGHTTAGSSTGGKRGGPISGKKTGFGGEKPGSAASKAIAKKNGEKTGPINGKKHEQRPTHPHRRPPRSAPPLLALSMRAPC